MSEKIKNFLEKNQENNTKVTEIGAYYLSEFENLNNSNMLKKEKQDFSKISKIDS